MSSFTSMIFFVPISFPLLIFYSVPVSDSRFPIVPENKGQFSKCPMFTKIQFVGYFSYSEASLGKKKKEHKFIT